MYRFMLLARRLDERLWVLNRSGRIPFVISGQGHEGAQVGITVTLDPASDWLVPYYRSIASCLVYGMSPREIMTAHFATGDDPSSGGRQMPGYYCRPDLPIISTSSPVATQVLHAAGVALAAKIRRTGGVVLTALGEGSSNQGDVHEALNFASVHDLPLVVVIENNGYAISVPRHRQYRVTELASRAIGYGMAGAVVDGSDVLACNRVALEAVERARSGGGPTLIEAKVPRLTGHSSDDDQTKYRTAQEIQSEKARDPLSAFRRHLVADGILTEDLESRLEHEIKTEVDDATGFAESQPGPDVSTAMRWVYAEEWPSEAPPSWGLHN